MNRNRLTQTAFALALAAICAFAGMTLTETPAEARPPVTLGNCPVPCSGGNLVSAGTCDRFPAGCHEVCKVYRNTSTQQLCYKTNECYAI